MKYRREIDGLRALAVVPVIFFHAGLGFFSGGFVGVDIFFVISGFLITANIVQDIESGVFSLSNFYERRVRRILPALYLMICIAILGAWLLLQPTDFIYFGKSVAGVVLFASNFIFVKNGYFEPASELTPLLHTWSLAVEEQYYLVFPLILLFLRKRRYLLTSIVGLGLMSLAWAQVQVIRQPEHAFFMMPSRFWELLAGGVAYMVGGNDENKHSLLTLKNQLMSFVGAILVAISLIVLDQSWSFPGVAAIPPVVGTVLILQFATPATIVGKVLSSMPLVAIGLISYSAYLIHQPILAFAKYRYQNSISPIECLYLISIIFIIAFLSWKFIERPFRDRNKVSVRVLYGLAIVGSISLFGLSFAIRFNEGFPDRFPMLAGFYSDSVWPEEFNRDESCIKKYGGEQYCKVNNIDQQVTDALIGDSHASHFYPGLREYLDFRGRNLIQQGAGGCPPFLYIDTGIHPLHGALKCLQRTDEIYRKIIESDSIKTVYLAFHHSGYFDQSAYQLRDSKFEITYENDLQFVTKALIRTIKIIEASGKEVRLIYDMPDLQNREPLNCLLAESRAGVIGGCEDGNMFKYDFEKYNELLSEVGQNTNAKIFYSIEHINNFPRAPSGDWLYRDSTHLSLKGSLFFASKFNFVDIKKN